MGLERGSGLVVLMLGAGLVSGLVPMVNAEALLIAAVLGAKEWWLPLAAAIAVGQSGAKVAIFLAARDGRPLLDRFRRSSGPLKPARAHSPRAGWLRSGVGRCVPDAGRVTELVRRPVAGSVLILVSAVGGVPPLAAMSILAGMARMRLLLFAVTCLTGRLLRFVLIALPVAGLWGGAAP